MMNSKKLGEIVHSARKEQGLTQVELASLAQVGPRFVGELERGKQTLAIEKVLQVFNALGVELSAQSRQWNTYE